MPPSLVGTNRFAGQATTQSRVLQSAQAAPSTTMCGRSCTRNSADPIRSSNDTGAHCAPVSTVAATRGADVRMNGSEWPAISFEERMETTEFRVHEEAHIVVDGRVCADCSTRECVVACPANLFVPTSDGGLVFNYEQCFECGTCYLVCNKEGALTWTYPEGGAGVAYKRA